MRRILAASCVVTLCGLMVVTAIPVTASAASAVVSARSGVDTVSVTGARNVAKAVVSFRADMNSMLASYLADYGDRLNAAELATAKELVAKADSSLNGVQGATARTSALASSGASKAKVLAASRAAEKAFTTSHDQALAALNQITPILQPKLGLLEAFGAKRDADAKLSNFSAVGAKITALTRTINASQ